MTPAQAIGSIQAVLETAEVDAPRLAAEALLSHLLNADRTWLYAHWREDIVTAEVLERLQALASRLANHEPLAYVTGQREFYGLDFLVDPRVLIPRPETELLVDLAQEAAEALVGPHPITIADIGTGSGAIAVTLAARLPQAIILATDASPAALEVASANAHRHGVAHRVRLLAGDLLAPLPHRVRIIVSNPPYIPSGVIPTLQPEVQREPLSALDGGPDGLRVIERLLEQAPKHLDRPGVLLMEIGADQSDAVRRLAEHLIPGAQSDVVLDLAGLPRVFRAWRPGQNTA